MNYWLDLFTVRTLEEFQKAGAKVQSGYQTNRNHCFIWYWMSSNASESRLVSWNADVQGIDWTMTVAFHLSCPSAS